MMIRSIKAFCIIEQQNSKEILNVAFWLTMLSGIMLYVIFQHDNKLHNDSLYYSMIKLCITAFCTIKQHNSKKWWLLHFNDPSWGSFCSVMLFYYTKCLRAEHPHAVIQCHPELPMLNVIKLSVAMPSVVLPSVVAPSRR